GHLQRFRRIACRRGSGCTADHAVRRHAARTHRPVVPPCDVPGFRARMADSRRSRGARPRPVATSILIPDRMVLSSYLTHLVIPLNLGIALLVMGVLMFIVRRRRVAVLLAAGGMAWVVFWSLPASSLWAGGRL